MIKPSPHSTRLNNGKLGNVQKVDDVNHIKTSACDRKTDKWGKQTPDESLS